MYWGANNDHDDKSTLTFSRVTVTRATGLTKKQYLRDWAPRAPSPGPQGGPNLSKYCFLVNPVALVTVTLLLVNVDE